MPINNINDDQENNRLSLLELRKFEQFRDVSDEDGEVILDDLLAFTRMILDVIN